MKINHKGEFYACLKPQNRKNYFKVSNSLCERFIDLRDFYYA